MCDHQNEFSNANLRRVDFMCRRVAQRVLFAKRAGTNSRVGCGGLAAFVHIVGPLRSALAACRGLSPIMPVSFVLPVLVPLPGSSSMPYVYCPQLHQAGWWRVLRRQLVRNAIVSLPASQSSTLPFLPFCRASPNSPMSQLVKTRADMISLAIEGPRMNQISL